MSSDQRSGAFTSQRLWGTIGGVVLLLGVGIGAFGAHIAAERIIPYVHGQESPDTVAGFEVPASYSAYLNYRTAVFYQLVHGLGIILAGLLGRSGKARTVSHAAGACFLLGIVLFCGPLYAMALSRVGGIHLIIPLGGMCFLLGWAFFITAAVLPRTKPPR